MAENIIKDVKLKIGTETQFQSKLKDLPLNTLVGTTDPIQEGELDTSIITKLNKAENALPKPTNDTTGSAGQVLKKTANGSEWGDAPSGGGKLYMHNVYGVVEINGDTLNLYIISSSANQIDNFSKLKDSSNKLVNGIFEPKDDSTRSYPVTTLYYVFSDKSLTLTYLKDNVSTVFKFTTLDSCYDTVTEL